MVINLRRQSTDLTSRRRCWGGRRGNPLTLFQRLLPVSAGANKRSSEGEKLRDG